MYLNLGQGVGQDHVIEGGLGVVAVIAEEVAVVIVEVIVEVTEADPIADHALKAGQG